MLYIKPMDELSDEKKAWLEAAQNGDVLASFNIGKYYMEAKKFDEAKKWLHKVAVQGHLGGLFKYGELLISLDQKDEAKNWLKIAADKGHVRANELLESL